MAYRDVLEPSSPLMPMNLFLDGRFTAAIVLGAAGGIIGALLGCVEFVRRDVI